MTPTPLLQLDRLYLRNFRCFAECVIDLHPQLTVLVAENGRGKTAVLDAIGIALGPFVDTITDMRQSPDFVPTDVRLNWDRGVMDAALQAEIVSEGYVAGRPTHWSRTRKREGRRTRAMASSSKDLWQAALDLRERSVEGDLATGYEGPPILPFIAFYGSNRFKVEHEQIRRKRTHGDRDRVSGYAGCLSSSVSLENVVDWYETRMKEVANPLYKPYAHLVPLIAAVEKAMRLVLEPTEWYKLDWDSNQEQLIVEHRDQSRLPPRALSDGIRTMVALVMDIARRCFNLNPHLGEGATAQTPGVLLIDEVDLHLHPGWQQQVVDLLRKAFPAMQIVLSTHSPHVLSTVDKESIRKIRFRNGEGWLEVPSFQTRGVESADVLERIMDVDPIPHIEEAQWLSDYKALIEDGKLGTSEAQTLRSKLIVHFGADHPLMLDCDRLIRFQAFKRSQTPPEKR